MRRAFLSCLSAIALLFTMSVAIIAWATREVPATLASASPPLPERAKPGPSAAPSPATSEAAPLPEPGFDGLGVAPLPPPLAAPAQASVASFATPEPARRGVPHRAPPAATGQRRAAAASVRRGLMGGMAELQRRVAGCPLSGATLSLAVESVKGGMRVVSARVEPRGASTEAGEACARAALSGQLIPAPGIEPGRRWQLPLAVRSKG